MRAAALLLLLCVTAVAAPKVDEVVATVSPTTRQFALQEFTLQPAAGFPAVNDSARAALTVELTAPSGRVLRLPAFHWQAADPFANAPDQETAWKARFTPVESGPYVFRVLLSRDAGPEREAARGAFQSLPARSPGFIRASGRSFKTDSGEDFFPIGANRCWGDARRTGRYLEDMDQLAAAGANCLRVWIAPWWIPLEPTPAEFDPVAAARLDLIVERADALGLRLILCIEQHGNLEPAGGEIGLWNKHPYNVANGGPCQRLTDYFTSTEARRLYKNRLRYLIARWGYSPAVMSWEFFNEVEWAAYGNEGFHRYIEPVTAWHVEMADYLRAHDPYGHLIATSSHIPLQRRLLDRRAIDFVQAHVYDQENLMGRMVEALAPLRSLPVPLLAGEFGLRQDGRNPDYVTLGIFSAAAAGAGAGALPWLSDVEDLKPYCSRITAARKILESSRWGSRDFDSVTVDLDPPPMGRTVRTLGLASKDQIVIFARADAPRPPKTAPGLTVRLTAPDGDYAVEAWNATEGIVIWQDRITAAQGALVLSLPDFNRDAFIRCDLLTPARP